MKTPCSVGGMGLVLCGLVLAARGQPTLDVAVLPGASLRLSWPAAEAGYQLEATPALGAAASWEAVPGTVEVDAARSSVVVPVAAVTRFFRLRATVAAPTTVVETSPAGGEDGVAVTRETVFRFSGPLGAEVFLTGAELGAEFGGRTLLSRAELSADRRAVTLFYLENLPASARVRVTLVGDALPDAGRRPLDADGDGQPGGVRVVEFQTLGTTALPGTAVVGHVYASERNADGSNRPLENVTITVDGAEETRRASTDASGAFTLSPSPAGRFFVHVDGRTAVGSRWPGGAYYPFVGKAWEAAPGRTNNPAGGTGEVFLPLIQADALQALSPTEETRVTFSPAVVASAPALAGVEVRVPPNTLFSENGARGGKMGIAPVAPDRLPGPLPPGLDLPLVITIQTDGPQNFDRPVPVRFPNLPDPRTGVRLPPGAKTVLWSFNHDTGRWEPQGTATITADGNFAETDPGVGVRQPGWHGVSPGSRGRGPRRGGGFSPDFGGGSPPLAGSRVCPGGDCEECTRPITCTIRQPGEDWLDCLLKCADDVLGGVVGDGPKPARSPIDTGLRCIGGPDKCAGRSDDTLTKARQDCMDRCVSPAPEYRTYIMPCEGYVDPCPAASLHGAGRAAATADLLPDRLVEQERFWQVEEEFLVRLAGTPKILETSSPDLPLLNAFFDQLAVRIQPGTASGVHLSPGERAELAALPRPAQFSTADWGALIDRFDSLQGNPLPADVAAAEAELDALISLLKERGWKYRLDGLVHGYLRLSRHRSVEWDSEAFPARPHYYYLKHHESGFEQRGRLNAAGQFEDVVLAPEGLYTVVYLDPVTGRMGGALFAGAPAGWNTFIPTAPLEDLPVDEADADGDRLPDLAERVIGTREGLADSDGDGVVDGDEVRAGTNPLDGSAQALGTVNEVGIPGSATEVVTAGDLAFVLSDPSGVSVFDVRDPLQPVFVRQLVRPPEANRVITLAAAGELLAIAYDNRVQVYAFTPAGEAALSRTIPQGGVTALAVVGSGLVCAGTTEALFVFDAFTGEQADRIEQPSEFALQAVEDLVLGLGRLPNGARLSIYRLASRRLGALGSIALQGSGAPFERGPKLTVAGGYAYFGSFGGYQVIDVRDPAAPVLVGNPTSLQAAAHALALASADRLLATTSDARLALGVSLFDATDPTVTTRLLGSWDTPGDNRGIAVHRGLVLAADSSAGLAVVHFLAPDRGTNPPAIALRVAVSSPPSDQEFAGVFRVNAEARDDVLVRDVEFYLDGRRAGMAGGFPFEAYLRAPAFAPGRTNFTLRAKATDTGGNSTWSAPILLNLIPDRTPPRMRVFTPADGSVVLEGSGVEATVSFNEPMDAGSLTAGLRLTAAGPDRQLGTADDQPVAVRVVYPLPDDSAALRPDARLTPGWYRVDATGAVRDRFNNPLAAPASWSFEVRGPVRWTSDASGLWTEPGRWSSGAFPGPRDYVRFEPANGVTAISDGNITVYDLVARGHLILGDPSPAFQFLSQVLSVARQAELAGTLSVYGQSALGEGDFHNAGLLEFVGGSGSSLRGHLVNDGVLRVEKRSGGGLSLQGDAILENGPAGVIELVGDPTLAGPFGGLSTLVNAGTLIKRGEGTSFFTPPLIRHTGLIDVQEGVLDYADPTSSGQHAGQYHVARGAVLRLASGQPEFGPDSRLSGEGTLEITGSPRIRGALEIQGAIAVSGGPVFSGVTRSAATLLVSSGGVTFNGSFVDLGPVTALSGRSSLVFGQAGEARVAALTLAGPPGNLGATLTVDTAVRVPGSMVVSNLAKIGGRGRLTIEGPLTLQGRVDSIASFVNSNNPALKVAVGGLVSAVASQALLRTVALTLEPGAELNLDGFTGLELYTLENRGLITKDAPGTVRLTGALRGGAGGVQVRGGTFEWNAGGTFSGQFRSEPAATVRILAPTALVFEEGSVVDLKGPLILSNSIPGTAGAVTFRGQLAASSINMHLRPVNFETGVTLGELVTARSASVLGGGTVTAERLVLRDGSGDFAGSGTLRTPGVTVVSDQFRLRESRVWENAGTLVLDPRANLTLLNNSRLLNLPGGTVELRNSLQFGSPTDTGKFTNNGALLKVTEGDAAVGINLENRGTVEVRQGALAFANQRGIRQSAGLTLLSGGTLSGQHVVSGGVFRGSGSHPSLASLELRGTGQLEIAGPGGEIGELSLGAATFTQAADGVLQVDLGGTQPGVGHDRLVVSRANLGGRLEVRIAPGYVAQVGDTFEIVAAAQGRSGQFATLSGADLGGGRRLEASYTGTAVVLRVVAQ